MGILLTCTTGYMDSHIVLTNARFCVAEIMNSAADFTTLLTNIGFANADQRNEIINQGLQTLEDLSDLSSEELKAVFLENKNSNRRRVLANQISLPVLACTKLEAVRYELELRTMCGSPMNQAQVQALNNAEAKKLARQKKQREEGLERSADLPNPEVPKLSRTNWRAVRDAFLELLSRKVGANGITLNYVIRANAVGNYDDPRHTTLNQKLVACALVEGPKYDTDAHDVYSLLSTTFADTEAEGIIKRHKNTRNARQAWKDIKVHFESTSFKNVLKTDALNMIRSSKYTGPKKNFDLSSLYKKHIEAHNMLEESGLPYSEQQKIQEFQQCLQEATAIEKSVDALRDLVKMAPSSPSSTVLMGLYLPSLPYPNQKIQVTVLLINSILKMVVVVLVEDGVEEEDVGVGVVVVEDVDEIITTLTKIHDNRVTGIQDLVLMTIMNGNLYPMNRNKECLTFVTQLMQILLMIGKGRETLRKQAGQ